MAGALRGQAYFPLPPHALLPPELNGRPSPRRAKVQPYRAPRQKRFRRSGHSSPETDEFYAGWSLPSRVARRATGTSSGWPLFIATPVNAIAGFREGGEKVFGRQTRRRKMLTYLLAKLLETLLLRQQD